MICSLRIERRGSAGGQIIRGAQVEHITTCEANFAALGNAVGSGHLLVGQLVGAHALHVREIGGDLLAGHLEGPEASDLALEACTRARGE